MKNIFFIGLLCFLYACEPIASSSIEVELHNKTQTNISLTTIKTSSGKSTLHLGHSMAGVTTLGTLDMSQETAADGSYNLTMRHGNKRRTQKMGYFSNGKPLESLMIIDVYTDSIAVRFE